MDPIPFELGGEHGRGGDRVEVGVLAFGVPHNDSIHAWSVGVDGRPKCWAIERKAMSRPVSLACISVPLSEIANSAGT